LEDDMRALIVYESMYGNTRQVAEQIGAAMQPRCEVSVVAVSEATDEMVDEADVLIVGGPTHMHGLSNRRSREMAKAMADRHDSGLTVEPDATPFGLREWFKVLRRHNGKVAATFDTRAKGPALLTGRASRAIARHLHRHGFRIAATRSFVIGKHNRLAAGELARARTWGTSIALTASRAGEQPRSAAA
jgi:flavodoxin